MYHGSCPCAHAFEPRCRRFATDGILLMFTDFPVLYVDVIVRRTIVACGGLAGAIVNHRLFQVSTARYSNAEGHLERKPYAGSVAARLGALTIIAFALLFLLRPMGFGMVGG